MRGREGRRSIVRGSVREGLAAESRRRTSHIQAARAVRVSGREALMARSIHSTSRDAAGRGRHGADGAGEARDDLAARRRIKRAVTRERVDVASPALTPPDAVPIRVERAGPYVHFPATEGDLVAVLARLPAGVATGLKAIVCELGAEVQRAYEEEEGYVGSRSVDPWVGRAGSDWCPGIWMGHIHGQYEPWSATIRLFGHVYDPARRDLDLLEPYLKLSMLQTFVHEVAHHHDATQRVARGRWLAHDRTQVEDYAERLEFDWVRTCVVPYLSQVYPAEVRNLEAWIDRHGGVAIPLEVLASADSRFAVDARGVRMIFPLRGAFEHLIEDVAGGADLAKTRVGFARELHYAEHYDEAIAALETVLTVHPRHVEARTLMADILVHLERWGEAAALARAVLATAPDHVGAWEVLGDACFAQRDWRAMADAADRALALLPEAERTSPWHRERALMNRARARIELGRLDDALEDVAALDGTRSPRNALQATALRAIAYLRAGRFEEALAIAEGARLGAHPSASAAAELAAVRYESARRLGRASEGLSAEVLETLERSGHGDWARRLTALP